MCRITKSVVADVFSGVKMVEYVSAAGTPLPGPITGQRGNRRKRRGREGGWERETRGGWQTGTGYGREERKGKGGREGEEGRGVPPASASISTSVCKTVSHCESRMSQG